MESREDTSMPMPAILQRPLTYLRTVDRGAWLPIVFVLAMVIFFALASPAFFSGRNFTATSGAAATLLIASLGASFVILMGSIDLSVGAIVLLVAAVNVRLLNETEIGLFVLPFSFLLGGLLGTLNGAITVFGNIPSFVVTLGTMSIFTGAALGILRGAAIMFDSPVLQVLANDRLIPYLPNIALFAIVFWVICVFAGLFTRFGRFALLIGGGETVARTAGLPVNRYKIAAFAMSGAMAGLAAVFSMARLGSVGPTLGQDLLLNTIAAIVVGGTALAGGVGGVQRTLIGVTIITMLNNGLNLMGVDPYWQMGIKGVVVIIAVLVGRNAMNTSIVK